MHTYGPGGYGTGGGNVTDLKIKLPGMNGKHVSQTCPFLADGGG